MRSRIGSGVLELGKDLLPRRPRLRFRVRPHLGDPAPGDLPVTFGGVDLVLLPERAVFRPDAATLYVADTHWGKTATFRAAGIAVPPGSTTADFARLTAAVRRTGAARLVILGDLLHARRGRREAATLAAVAHWRAENAGLRVELIEGNHDRAAGPPDPAWEIAVRPDPTPDPPLVLKHFPDADPDGPVLAGHEHPAVRLTGPGGETLKLPCFRVGRDVLTLPAFSTFADGGTVRPRADERICVVAEEEEVIYVTPRAKRPRFG